VPNVTIEYVIMLPLLILQVILFPLTASWLMNTWVTSRRTIALQEAASNIGSNVQQLYFTLNHATIPVGTSITEKSDVPPFIEDYAYTGSATLKTVSSTSLNSSKVLTITLGLRTVGTTVTTSVILGPNAQWLASTFKSNSTNAGILAQKVANGTGAIIWLSFTG
jgi:hypothetical protein